VKNGKIKYLVLMLGLLSGGHRAWGQSAASQNAWGGANDVFDYPVGARALAMGGAFVSAADDPFALYWNPAALEKVHNLGLGLYYTNLPGSSQYSYLAYVHPTLFIGTFSAGLISLSTPGIDIYDDQDPIKLGTLAYSRTMFLFGYGVRPFQWIALGATFKIERAVLPGYPDALTGNTSGLTESAFGADAGVLITPRFSNVILRNFSLGLTVQNAVQRSMRAVERRESTPRNYRFGLAKEMPFGTRGSNLLLAIEYDKGANSDGAYRMGLEYSFHNLVFLRSGMYGNQLTYGGGMRIAGVQFDYSYWNGYESFLGSSHRISVVFNIGKDREQRLNDYRERETRRIELEVAAKRQAERADAVASGLSRARLLYAKNDFPGAFSAISRVLIYDVTGNDPDLQEARQLQQQINTALEEQRQREEAAILARNEEEMTIKRNNLLIEEHYQKALAAFGNEEYPDAIAECDRALTIDANSERVKDLRSKADEQLRQKIYSLVERAKSLQQQERGYEAITVYNTARQLARGLPLIETFIAGQISAIDGRLTREDLIRRAKTQEMSQNWAEAAALYKDALAYDPGNLSLQQRYDEANARANAKEMTMPDNVRDVYKKGVQAFGQGKYEEAIRYFEEARSMQPLNKNILKALDAARENLQKQQSTQPSGR